MLNPIIKNFSQFKVKTIINHNKYYFGLGNVILQYIRTRLNRIRWEENRQFTALQQRSSNVPKNTEEANKLFIATQQNLSLSQKARMQRIDSILGTNTYFHEAKIYQERLDSDHLMDLSQLKKQHKQVDRKTLNWLNPKANVKIRYKNKKKYYQFISKLRTYPVHDANKYNFEDQKSQNTILFLGKETVYSKISLKPVELTMSSIEEEVIGITSQKPFQSQKYYYFRPIFAMQLFRIEKKYYNPELLTDQKIFQSLQMKMEEVISLQEIYNKLKEYDMDERVNQYLKKIENNRLEYFFSEFSYDNSENVFAVMIDLLGTEKEYCLIVKKLSNVDESMRSHVVFNIRPKAVFSQDGKSICYVQRSMEGGWIQLTYRSIESFWSKKSNEVTITQETTNPNEVIYRCSPQKQIILGNDSNKSLIFLTIRQYNKQFSESLFLVNQKKEQEKCTIELVELDKDNNCKYYYDLSPLGIIFSKFRDIKQSYLKYGENSKQSKFIYLIPYKEHISLFNEQKIGMHEGLLPINSSRTALVSPNDFDIAKKKVIYNVGQNQFIKEIQTRSSHLIIVLNLYSVYSKAIIYCFPFKPSAHPHSLILGGGANIKLRKNSYNFQNQTIEFTKPTGIISTEKSYNIWKRELLDSSQDFKRYHSEKIIISQQEDYPLQIYIHCKGLYAQDSNIPVLVYFPTKNQDLQQTILRQFLEKGVVIVEFRGRGTFSTDVEHYIQGSRHNFPNMMDDLQQVIEFIGNHMTKNISLYCKGEISSLVGLWFNVYFPFLFNTTVLHNGFYDLEHFRENATFYDFLGPSTTEVNAQGKAELDWSKFNIFKHKFKPPFAQTASNDPQIKIGTLQNILISSDKDHRLHSRKLIHRLRQSIGFKYEQVYLKQYESEYEADLTNLSYIYSKIRVRLETEINDPSLDEEE